MGWAVFHGDKTWASGGRGSSAASNPSFFFGSAQCCPPWRTPVPVGCVFWLCFLAVFQCGRVQQLPYQWGCINLSLWLPVFSRILQNIPAAMGIKSSLMTSRWLGMSRLLPTPWAGDAQKWICKCIHCLLSLFSPHRNNHCSPLQMLWGDCRIP